MLKENTLFRTTVPLTVKRKNCHNIDYFFLFRESLTASIGQWAILKMTATTALVF
jgi:hypothetical protein